MMGIIKKTQRIAFISSGIKFTYSESSGYREVDSEIGSLIEFTQSGTFIPLKDVSVDVFIVGPGGGGGYSKNGGGGGAGYTVTQKNVQLIAGDEYEIVIGAGGTGASSQSKRGSAGGVTSAFGFSANGGYGGGSYSSSNARTGGAGGSGGGAGLSGGTGGAGGVDGANGEKNGNYAGGLGQGTTTRAFGEEKGKLYATGGDGSNGSNSTVNGNPNTGDGASGGADGEPGGTGGSGIVIIRKAVNA